MIYKIKYYTYVIKFFCNFVNFFLDVILLILYIINMKTTINQKNIFTKILKIKNNHKKILYVLKFREKKLLSLSIFKIAY